MLMEKLNDKLYHVVAKSDAVFGYRLSIDSYADYRFVEGRSEKELRSLLNWSVTIINSAGNYIFERRTYRSYSSAYNSYMKALSSYGDCIIDDSGC